MVLIIYVLVYIGTEVFSNLHLNKKIIYSKKVIEKPDSNQCLGLPKSLLYATDY